MSDRETMVIERGRIKEAHSLLDLARYVLQAGMSGADGLDIGEDELQGLDYLMESIQAVIG